ncbi:MAG: hypothetical protein HC860_16475 [Alkalinema sp. RU_4_3]|nr:hypothetical protein [Alkalinema sp. RU_4_3]
MPYPPNAPSGSVFQSDLIWRDRQSGANELWQLNGTKLSGSTTEQQLNQNVFTAPPVVDANWKLKGTGDFNGDGLGDMVWRNELSGVNAVWYMNGSQFVSKSAPQQGRDFNYFTTVADRSWDIQAIADFNQDGFSDLVWRHKPSGINAVWYLRNNQFVQNTAAPVQGIDFDYFMPIQDSNWSIKGAADFNNDGKTDLLWRNQATGANVAWFLNKTQFARNSAAPQQGQDFDYFNPVGGQDWDLSSVGYFNGDRSPDLVWRNKASGENVVWFLNGTKFAKNPTAPQGGQDFSYFQSRQGANWEIVGNFHRTTTAAMTDMQGSTIASAHNLGTINGLRTFGDSVVTAAPDDYFKFTVTSNQSIATILKSSTADLSLDLLDASGKRLPSYYEDTTPLRQSGTEFESISRVLTPGTYYFRVSGGGANSTYSFSILGQAPASGNQADRVIELTNFYRTQVGANALVKNTALSTSAYLHSQDMAVNNYFEHTGKDGSSPGLRAQRAGYVGWVSENLALGARNAEEAMEGWLYSTDGHRQNLLDSTHRVIGTGFYDMTNGDPYGWEIYWTSVFD